MANPFDETEDVVPPLKNRSAVSQRGGGAKSARSGLGLDPVPSYTTERSIEDEVEDYEREVEKYMQKSLDSTQRSRQQLESSEQLGEAAARDLLEQREKLERTDKNLDDIHRTTQLTQRSLNSLKSLFGGYFKNKFSRVPKEVDKTSDMPASKSENQLAHVVEDYSSGARNSVATSTGVRSLGESSREQIKGTRWEAMDSQIDENLGDMSQQLARLKALGSALGDEVDDQNRLLDRIHQKTDRNDAIVRHQDSQMKGLLGYAKPTTGGEGSGAAGAGKK